MGRCRREAKVASSPPTVAGVPQDEQKRPSQGSSVPQLMQKDMSFPAPVYRFTKSCDAEGSERRICDLDHCKKKFLCVKISKVV